MEVIAALQQEDEPPILRIHCENVELFKVFKERLEPKYPDLGRDEPLTDLTWAHCRPAIVEAESVHSALFLADYLNCPIVIVHLSSGLSLDSIRRAKARGQRVLVETTPLYLETDAYSTGQPGGRPFWTRVQPSVKFREDAEALWDAVNDGTVDFIGSDHAASTSDVYEGRSVWDKGASGRSLLGIELPIMLDAVGRGRLTMERLVEIMAATPAKTLGLERRKGRIGVGYDADIVLCDLNEQRAVTPADLHSRADHSSFVGRTLRGWPTTTILRGRVIWTGSPVPPRGGLLGGDR
jgi:dihydroorotase-like cyclic amidohydrolase